MVENLVPCPLKGHMPHNALVHQYADGIDVSGLVLMLDVAQRKFW